jgi:hypothetical protein
MLIYEYKIWIDGILNERRILSESLLSLSEVQLEYNNVTAIRLERIIDVGDF